jgi:predicted RNA-binding Zn ribbon-like protein
MSKYNTHITINQAMSDWDPKGVPLEPSLKPAPGSVRLVQSLINSWDIDAGVDALETNDACAQWLRERGLFDDESSVGDSDRRRVVRVREAFRELLVANCASTAAPDAASTINQAIRRAKLRPLVLPNGTYTLEPHAPAMDGALGRIVAVAMGAMADGSWDRLKVCRNDTCRWCFYDNSRNRSGRWCTAQGCGNQVRVRAHRARSVSRA